MSDDHLKGQIVKHYAGSHAYGTSTPESDVDFRGIFLAEKKFVLTPFFNVREVNDVTEEDTKFFELNHFMELCVDANPNILETLWVDEQDIVQSTEMYEHLRSYRDDLLSTKIAYTYTGYAHNQATRMKNHHGWMAKEQVAERRLREIYEKYPCKQVIDWMYSYFPHYVVDRIDTSAGQNIYVKGLIDFDKFLRDSSLQLISTTSLAQHHFVRLVHNYLPQKVLDRDFNLLNYNHGYELIHYGDNIFAITTNEDTKTVGGHGEILWDSKKARTSEELKVIPSLIVKFNKKEFEELNENRKHYHEWKKNRNEKRSQLESLHGYDCYSDDTEFLTENGWKFYDEITKDDKLATFDKNHIIEYQNYYERFENKFTGNMYHFIGQHQDTYVTSNHKMYIKEYARNYKKDMSEWKFVDAAQLKETYKILNTIVPKTNEYSNIDCPTSEMDLMTYLKVMGWFISDGCINFKDRKPKSMYISQSKPNQSMRGSLTKLKKNGKLKYREYKFKKKDHQNNDESRYTFSRDVAEKMYNDCGHGSANKRIPSWVFDLSKRKKDILLKSMLEGDGTIRKLKNNDTTHVYYTTNSLLADDVQRLAFLCGYKTTKWGPYKSDTEYKKDLIMYQVHINMKPKSERINTTNNLQIIPVVDHRTVCFSVPNSTLVTRRNGKISLHSNCKHAMHVVRLLRTAEEALETGVVNVRRPDAKELLEIRNGAWSYDEMLAYFEEKDKYIKEVAVKNSKLRKRADIKVAAKVMEELYEMYWYNK